MEDLERTNALRQLKARRDLRMHVGTYLIVNAMLVGIWAFNGAGSFWPGWVMLFWGLGLAFHGWSTFFSRPIRESDIQEEMRRVREG